VALIFGRAKNFVAFFDGLENIEKWQKWKQNTQRGKLSRAVFSKSFLRRSMNIDLIWPLAYTNPCARGKPLTNAYGTPISCNYLIEPNGGCPHEDYW
jgi:hypothetical protein